jgi:hypothetical protein
MMTGLESAGEQDAALQGPSQSEQHEHHPSERSSEFEYEIAKQLIQHSQGRRASPDGGGAGAGVPERNGDHRSIDQGLRSQEENSRTSSQERVSDAPYAPITVPPALGQICR